MKTKISPMFLTYYMLKWNEVKQRDSSHRCTICGKPMQQTEILTDEKGQDYEGFVCHVDKQVTWVRAG